MNFPKISIITPSYNQGKFIEDTILSVLNQDYPNLEYIIIDGGSNDNSVEIIRKYESRLKYWVSEKDKGQTHAINKGFKLATGDIIAWLNSDDMYCTNTLKLVATYFNKNPEANVVVGNGLFMNANGNIYLRKHPNISNWLEKHLVMSIFQPSTFLKRCAIDEIGYLNENYHMVMDAEWFCRINRKFPFHVTNRDFSIFRWHPASKSSGDHYSEMYKRYVTEHLSVLKYHYPKYKRLINRFPNTSFAIHTLLGKIARYVRRVYKGELYKLNDTNVM